MIYQRGTPIYPWRIVGNRPPALGNYATASQSRYIWVKRAIHIVYELFHYHIRTIQSDTNGLHYSNNEKGLPVAGSVQLADPENMEI